ncbi:MAG: GNAT family N-acetyltransferase [Polyangiaceae bacterium]|nr:GNAT family N-acetyltransferase [Polyangiaceae bacterium]
MTVSDSIKVATPALHLLCGLVPWDIEVFGFPVAQITELEVFDAARAARDYAPIRGWLERQEVRVLSCRLPHDRLRESMFLEAQGLRFVEMVIHPKLAKLESREFPADTLNIAPATADDLPGLVAIGERAFHFERYHVDPRLDPRLGDKRYARWVRNSFQHPTQRLLKIEDGSDLVAMFVVERRSPEAVYWHLTAIAPEWQGKGYGKRVWRAMLRRHREDGASEVVTTISARNSPVLGLYATLGFSFLPPDMTFHWVREA